MRWENPDGRVNLLQLIRGMGIGGMERVVRDLCRHLDKNRFNVMVCCLSKRGRTGEELQKEGYKVYLCSEKAKLNRYTKGWEIRDILRRERVHILHSHNTQAFLDGLVGAKLAHTPVFVHTDHVREFPDRIRYMAAEKMASYFVDEIVGVSQHVRQDLIEYERISPDKISIIHNGTDFSPCKNSAVIHAVKEEFNIRPEERVVGCVARLRPQKGYELFMRTAARILKEMANVKFLIVGDGEEYEKVANLCNELGIRGKVRLAGARADVERILPVFDVFLLTSHYEGMPVCLLESMASGVPVVATAVGGVPEVIQDGVSGCLVQSRDPDGIARVVVGLLRDDDLRKRMGEAASHAYQVNFTVTRMVAQYTALYERHLADKNHAQKGEIHTKPVTGRVESLDGKPR